MTAWRHALDAAASVPFEIIAVRDFFPLCNVPPCEDANTELAQHLPLLRLAVWVAAVVDEPGLGSLSSGVQHFVRPAIGCHVQMFCHHTRQEEALEQLQYVRRICLKVCSPDWEQNTALGG